MGLERINGCKLITVSINDKADEKGNIGYIDYNDYTYTNAGKPTHKFAFIALNDWETEVIAPIPTDDSSKAEMGKVHTSQVSSLKVRLEQVLMRDETIDIVVIRRPTSEKQRHDFLVKVDDLEAMNWYK